MRQVILDTETTGLDPAKGDRIIEIACVELVNRRYTGKVYQQYINPERDISAGAQAVHGLTREFLSDKPLFATIAPSFLEFIKEAELIIHNAAFDEGFLNYELTLASPDYRAIRNYCAVTDTLLLARKLHPGQKNNLDALCKRYRVDNSQRDLHGALLDAKLLAGVYLAMTGGQSELFVESSASSTVLPNRITAGADAHHSHDPLVVLLANTEELEAHQNQLKLIAKRSRTGCVWEEVE